MTSLFRNAGQSAAESTISGVISINATWTEDIYFLDPDDGEAMDLTGLDFQMQFRESPDDTGAVVTLSTDAGTLSLVADSSSVTSILRISSDAGTFTAYEGDMIVDLIGIDGSDNVTHYGHGVVTFCNDPVAI